MRAISTAVDTTLFALLLGAAATVLVVGTAGVGSYDVSAERTAGTSSDSVVAEVSADEMATTLATTTLTVEYTATPTRNGTDGIDYAETGGGFERTTHGTAAGLLGAGAVSAATLDGEALSPAVGGFGRRVRNATYGELTRPGTEIAVTAIWTPYDGAPIEGRLHAGPTPSRTATVRAATMTVASPVPRARDRAMQAARANGTEGVATVVAATIIRGLFPPDETRIALRGDSPTDSLTAHRYRRVGRLTDAAALDVGNSAVERMNGRLREALASRLAADMHRRFATPRAAARSVETGTVRIRIRTWSP